MEWQNPSSILAGLAFAFLLLRFVRSELTAPPVTAELQPPIEAKHVLSRACSSSHALERRLSWFHQIVPAYFALR
jgi:hypothetical protein